jgi:hypothetical protein
MMKPIMTVLCAVTAAIPVLGTLPVEENVFFRHPVNFSPAEERHLDQQWLQKPPEVYPFAQAEVKKQNGVPWPFVDGKAVQLFTRSIQHSQINGLPVARLMRENGVQVFILDIPAYQREAAAEKGFTLDQTTFAAFERQMKVLLATVPDAKVILRLWLMNLPADYLEKHPEAVLTGEDGKTDWGSTYYSTHSQRPNFLNEWRRYTGEFLYKFIRMAGESRYAPHIAGFYLGAMNSGEWWYYKGKGDVGWDYSAGRKAAFKHYLQVKYGDNHVEILKKLWNVDSTEEVYRLPTLKERNQFPLSPNSKVSDYNQVLNQPITNAAIYFAQIIKTQTSGRCLAGMEIHAGLKTFRNNGTVFLNHLLDAPEIDFLGGPSGYEFRCVGNYSQERAVLPSLQARNKFWFAEEDIRTHAAYGTLSGAAGQPPLSREHSLAVIRRQFAAGACHGYPGYLMDFGWPWFHDLEIAGAVRECNIIFEYLSNAGKLKRRSEIALVGDQESQFYSNYYANPTLNRDHTLPRSGLDADFFELRDFLKPGVAERYKLVVFLNIRALSDEERAGIESLKKQRRTLVFLHDAGIVSLNRLNAVPATEASRLTGIELAGDARTVNGKMIYEPAALLRYLNLETALPDEEAKAGRTVTGYQVSYSDAADGLYVGNVLSGLRSVDPDAPVLGKDGKGNAILAMKQFPEWTSVYGAACLLPSPLLRALAVYSGITLPTDQADVVFSAGDVVAVHAVSDGKRQIVMPQRGDVVELFSRQTVARNTQTFTYDFKFGETRMFVTGDANVILNGIQTLERQTAAEIAAFREKYPAPQVNAALFNWQRFQRPETYCNARKQAFDNRYGSFPMNGASPSAYLVADAAVLTEPARALREGAIPDLYSDAARMNTMRSGAPPQQWEALAGGHPFVYAQQLGIGAGQRGKVAFYLQHTPNRALKILFTSTDNAKLSINNTPTAIPEHGAIITLPGESSLFMIELDNPDGNAGFSIKFYEPEANASRGAQLPFGLAAKNLQVRLAPPGYSRQLVPVAETIANPDLANLEYFRSGWKQGTTRFLIDPLAAYTLSAAYRGSEEAGGTLLLAFNVYDKDGRHISSREVHFLAETETELAKPANVADTVIYLKNADSWQGKPAGGGNGYVAFNIDRSGKYGDLPNRNLSGAITGIEKNAEEWAVTLSGPVGKNYPAGTAVRQHRNSSTYNTVQVTGKLSGSGETAGKLAGMAVGNPVPGRWWPGACFAHPLIVVNLRGGSLKVESVGIRKEIFVEQDAPADSAGNRG